MPTLEHLQKLTTITLSSPLLRPLRDRYGERQFARRPGTFHGVFPCFEAAARATPKRSKVGYDHAEFASMYQERQTRVFASDYPVLFWLERIFREANTVFDFGGHVGLAYYAYQRYLAYPSALRWRVCDLPQIVERARELAASNAAHQLSFTSEFSESAEFDVLLAAGSLQYVEQSLADKLRDLPARPKHLILNKLPLRSNGVGYVTLQNTLHSYNPYAVRNRETFLRSLEALGYTLIDEWENYDVRCQIPFHPEHSLDHYKGLYLRLDPAPGA